MSVACSRCLTELLLIGEYGVLYDSIKEALDVNGWMLVDNEAYCPDCITKMN